MNESTSPTIKMIYHVYKNDSPPQYGIIATVAYSAHHAVTPPFSDNLTIIKKLVAQLNAAQVTLDQFRTLYLSDTLFSFFDSIR